MSKQHVERCFDMSNVAVFGNMLNDFFPSTPATCRIRHVEATCQTLLRHVAGVDGALISW